MLQRSSGRSREVVACENRTGGLFFLFISRRDPYTSNVMHEIFADWQLFVFCENLFFRLGQIGFA